MELTKEITGKGSKTTSRWVLWTFVALMGGLLPGCKSQPEPDYRPSWVREAEARLQQPPTWQVSGSGVDSGNETQGRSSFFGSGRGATDSDSSQVSSGRQREAASTAARTPVAEPPGVQWGETKITVSVED